MRSKRFNLQRAVIMLGVWLAFLFTQNALANDTRTWQFRTPMPTARTGVSAVELNGIVYVMGGIDAQGNVLDVVELYDPVTDSWENGPSLRTPRYNATAVVFDGDIYLIGGRDTSNMALKKVERFDVSDNDWNSFDNLHTEREGACAVVLDGELYVMGGSNASANILDSVEFLDDDDRRWEESDDWDLDVPRASFASVVVGEFAYSIGGYSSFGPIGLMQRYHQTQGTADLSSVSPARGGLGASFLDESIYAMGGRRSNNQVVNTVNRFLPDQNRWETAPSMNTPREAFAVVSVADQIFVFGGNDDDGNILASVEAFSKSVQPSPGNDVLVTDEDVEMSLNVLVNDTDPAGGALTITSFSQPQHGEAEQLNANTFTFTPAPNYFGSDQFSYTVQNETGGTAQAVVRVTIQPVNDAPWIESLPVTGAAENAPYTYVLTGSDIENDELRYEVVSAPAWLNLNDNQDGTANLTGTPTSDDLGEHQIVIGLTDGAERVEQAYILTVVSGPPSDPTLLSPADNSLNVSTSPTLSWEAVGAASFELTLSRNDAFTDIVLDASGIIGTSFEVTNLEPNTDYFWRVRGINAAGESDWSATRYFRTDLSNDTEDELPERIFSLAPNYPNPFRERTRIAFELTAMSSESIELDIFDIHGRLITRLTDGYFYPGNHTVSWEGRDAHGRDVASGAYLVRLKHGQEQHTRTIMLIR